jgi:plastocyanin
MKSIPLAIYVAVPTAAAVLFIAWGCGGGGGGGSTSSTPTPTPIPTNSSSSTPSPSPSTTPSSYVINVVPDAAVSPPYAFATPVTVQSGTSVTWNNETVAPHNITWVSTSPSSSPGPGADIDPNGFGGTGASSQMSSAWIAPTVTQATTYSYRCTFHSDMFGSITVTP